MTIDRQPTDKKLDEAQQEFWGNSEDEEHKQVVMRPYEARKDPFIYRIAAATLAFTAVSGILAGIFLSANGGNVPDQIWMLSSAALGAFAVLLKIEK